MSVSAIIVNYYTGKFLIPLLKVLNRDSIISEIIVVNNSPSDELDDHLASFNKTKLIVNIKNEGFAKAVNIGTAIAKGDWLLLINPDTKPNKNCIKKLLKGAIESDALIAGPRFYWDDNKEFRMPPALGYSYNIHASIQASLNSGLDACLFSFNWLIRHERFWSQKEPFFEPFLSGACLLIKNDKSYFMNCKIFDERYFLYYEDTDLCASALINGKHMVCVPDAEVIHYWSQSPSKDKAKRMQESMRLFTDKFYYKISYEVPSGVSKLSNIIDFGLVENPPEFKYLSNSVSKNLFFEIGLNPYFVPFMQTTFKTNPYMLSQKNWEKLGSGTYFARLREKGSIKNLQLWSWKKL